MPPFTSPCLSFPRSAREGWRREKLLLARGAETWLVMCESLAGHESALRPRAVLDRAQGTPSASCHPAARSSTLRLSSHQNPVLYIFIPKEGSGNDPPSPCWQGLAAPPCPGPPPAQAAPLPRALQGATCRSRRCSGWVCLSLAVQMQIQNTAFGMLASEGGPAGGAAGTGSGLVPVSLLLEMRLGRGEVPPSKLAWMRASWPQASQGRREALSLQ